MAETDDYHHFIYFLMKNHKQLVYKISESKMKNANYKSPIELQQITFIMITGLTNKSCQSQLPEAQGDVFKQLVL